MNVSLKKQVEALTDILSAAMDSLIATLFYNQEIVLHDLTTPEHSVVKIINGHVSGRKVGDSVLSGPDKDLGFAGLLSEKSKNKSPMVIRDYTTVSATGKELSSASTIYYSTEGQPIMAFCINVDNSFNNSLKDSLNELIAMSATGNGKKEEHEVENVIEHSIRETIDKYTSDGAKVNRARRLMIVSELNQKGIFKMRGGVPLVAGMLGVTRFTVYNDLEKINEK
ncbi:PAS domain-containing protein [Enterobacter mori]|uniref:helix-turn-helix transcriptional regulator n=1 Tax=Enterobacter mori TaxID=539813 RepID=UPI00398BB275